MATKNNPGEFDCYGAAEPDEPIFILRASDILAPLIVMSWSEAYKDRKKDAGELDDRARKKIEEAQKCALDMAAWYRKTRSIKDIL